VEYSVVIATKGRPEQLRETLATLAAADPPPSEVIVVDGDPERSARGVGEAVRYLESEPGASLQRNLGLDEATGAVVVFADDDVTIPADAFAVLDRAYAENDVVGATVRIVEPDDTRIGAPSSPLRRFLLGGGPDGLFTSFGYPRYLTADSPARDVELMLGCFLTARTEDARAVRFDESLGAYALAEDEDFSYRLSKRGRIRYLPDAVVVHHKYGFGGRDPRSYGRLVVRNRTYLLRKNFRPRFSTWLRYALFLFVLLAHRLVNREWKGALGLVEGAAQAWRPPSP
jgi:GT2 family glycosyltransferase